VRRPEPDADGYTVNSDANTDGYPVHANSDTDVYPGHSNTEPDREPNGLAQRESDSGLEGDQPVDSDESSDG
jgi:hypothetical protein